MNTDESFRQVKTQIVTTDLLGKAKMPNARYENPDGTPLIIDIDYHGKKRDVKNPSAGPFEKPEIGKQLRLKVW
jgi:alpha-N-arabinofuranosidase